MSPRYLTKDVRLPHVMEPDLRTGPKRNTVDTVLTITYRLLWIAVWIFVGSMVLTGIGAAAKLLFNLIHAGWSAF
jgi:hypothetical protein